MKPLENHIYRIISESGFFYSVRPHPQIESATLFIVNGVRPGITTHIVACDRFNYISFMSYRDYSAELTDDFELAINSLNIMAPLNTKILYRDSMESGVTRIYTYCSLFISGAFPDKELVMGSMNNAVDTLVQTTKKLDDFRAGMWKPSCKTSLDKAGGLVLFSRQLRLAQAFMPKR